MFGAAQTITNVLAMDANGSCQVVTAAQCWNSSTGAAVSLSQTNPAVSTTFACKSAALASGKCWESDAEVAVSAAKGRSPKAADGGKCVTLTATQCVKTDGTADTISALNAANTL